MFCFQHIAFSQGLIWKSQVIQRSDKAMIYKTKEQGSYELPSWSNNEKKILFTLSKGGYGNDYSNLYTMDTKTGVVEAITNERNLRIESSNGDLFKTDEFIYTVDEGEKKKLKSMKIIVEENKTRYEVLNNDLYNQLDDCSHPSFSPDGQWVVYDAPSDEFLRDGTAIQQIYKMNIETGDIQQLTQGQEHKRRAKWAPDGYILLYEQFDGQFREWSLYITDYNGKRHRRLTESIGDETYGSFSPDSEWIVYSSNRLIDDSPIKKNVLIVRGVYNNLTYELTTADFYDTAPDWSKNSNKIVFQTSPKDPVSYNGSWIAIIDLPKEFLEEK